MENNGVEKSAGLTSSGSPCEADKALAKLVADEVVHAIDAKWGGRSEEHTSELQSR